MRKSCSVLWTFSHVINIILRGMIKGWWYRYQSRQTNTVNIIWYGSFRITSRINPRSISSLELKLSGWYWCLGLIRDVIRKELYNILYLSILHWRWYFLNTRVFYVIVLWDMSSWIRPWHGCIIFPMIKNN
jgi:hypothetical protein